MTEEAKTESTVTSELEITRRYFMNSVLTKEEAEEVPTQAVRVYPKEKQNEIGGVRVGVGLTINIGNFESCRLDVALELPCISEDAEEAYGVAKAFVDTKLEAERDAIHEYKRSLK